MSWRSNGSTTFATIANNARVRFDDTDHAFGLWFRRVGNSSASTSGVILDQLAGSYLHRLAAIDSDASSLQNQLQYRQVDAAGDGPIIYWTGPIVNDTWYHVVMQRVSNTLYLYVDGVEAATGDATAVNASDPGVDVLLGDGYGGQKFNGYIAEFFKYGRSLTTTEITALAGGQRIKDVLGFIDDIDFYLPMDSDLFRDYHNRVLITNSGMTTSDTIEPPLYDAAPQPQNYYIASTNKKARVTHGPYLDVTKETPYGYHAVNTDDISNAVNWALKYQREGDPSARSPAGGPEGAFTPYIPPCDRDDYWLSTGQWFVPNWRGIYLIGNKMHHAAGEVQGANSGGASRVRFNITDKSMPCIINQAGTFVMHDISFFTEGDEEIGMLNHRMTLANAGTLTTRTSPTAGVFTLPTGMTSAGPIAGEKIQLHWDGGSRIDVNLTSIASLDSVARRVFTFSGGTGDDLPAEDTAVTMYDWCYVADNSEGFGTGSANTQPCTRLMMHRFDIDGFDIGIQNAGYAASFNCDHHTFTEGNFNTCLTGYKNVNDQGLDIKFETIEWRQNNGILFDFEAGGFMKADHILSAYSGSKILNIGIGGTVGVGPGKNNGYFKITDVKTDSEALFGGWIVYMEGDAADVDRWCHITLDGGMHARRANNIPAGGDIGSQNRFARIVGRTTLTVRDYAYPGVVEVVSGESSSYGDANFAPDILFDRCQLLHGDADDTSRLWTPVEVGMAPNSFAVQNCTRNSGLTDGVDRPIAVDDLPDKPTVSEMNTAINEANTYNPPAAGASGSIVWD